MERIVPLQSRFDAILLGMKTAVENRFFRISMWWRIFYGLLRIALGLALLRVVGRSFDVLFTSLMSHELMSDPSDVLYRFVMDWLMLHPVSISYFLAFYFIFWGILDVVLSLCLLREVRLAFPLSLSFIGVFMCYELVRFSHTHSLMLLAVIGLDAAIAWLIFRHYRKLQTAPSTSS